jgi:hypothetical protein
MVPIPRLSRLLVFLFIAILALAIPAGDAAAQTVKTVNRDDILYILPFWSGLIGADRATVDAQIADLRQRVGPEGPYVKLGFSVYIDVVMQDWTVDISNPAAVRAAVAGTITQIDDVVAKAHAHGVPITLATLTAIRQHYDPVQTASEAQDIRSMQWYADNVLAGGWWTHSRYARKQFAIQQAYMREVAKEIARLMRQYPDTLVAASGDGEVELAYARPNPLRSEPYAQIFSDYSPFMVAEFRDWLRLGGLYAAGADFAGQGYSLGARYAGDATPGQDTNGDGHTLNGDFGANFQTWNLLHFDWSLTDQFLSADPCAIPLATYSSPGYDPMAAQIPGGFDPPRTPRAMGTDAWWDLWVLFKQTMLRHHNQEFAKWMTTSAEPATGFTIPPARWYSYQIAGDYLFNGSPQNPNERWYSSMSSLSTADTSPYGSLGITAFNIDFGSWAAVTLSSAAPAIAARDVRWGLIEWHPGVLPNDAGVSSNLGLFRAEMDLVAQYRPSLLQPFGWDIHKYEIKDTAFQTTLAELVARLKDGTPSNPQMTIDAPRAGATVTQPLTISGWAIDLGKIRGPGRGPGIDLVNVYAYPNPGSNPPAPIFLGSAAYGAARPDVAAKYGSQFSKSGFSLGVRALPVGRYVLVAFGRSTVTETFNITATASVTVDYGAAGFSPATLTFGTTKAGSGGALVATTPAQVITASYSGPGIPVWSASSTAPWLQITSGPGAGQFTVAIVNPGNVIGGSTSLAAAVTITASNVGVGGRVPVALTVKQGGMSAAPFGAFDTPANGAGGLQGSFALTGWALDDIAVDHVEIWRDLSTGEDPTHAYTTDPAHPGYNKVYIANPLFVTGSRTDVEGLYPNNPFANRAGWGYLLLSWGLPDQGNGTYNLHAFAFDVDGHSAALGTKTITVDNAHATRPFGAIDTPEYGSTKSGAFWNYGWALTPNASPACTIVNGWVTMHIDSGPGVVVTYGAMRADIAASSSGFSNGSNSGGAYYLDTTTLSNGMHQIGWLVYDSCGRGDGIGSRFFTVLNASAGDGSGGRSPVAGSGDAVRSARPPQPLRAAVERTDPIAVGRLDGEWQSVWPSTTGQRVIEVTQGERIEIRLPPAGDGRYAGFQAVNGEQRALPLGSSLDAGAGIFYWQPAPGFLGSFGLVFVAPGGATDVPVRVVVGPPMRANIDTPSANEMVTPPFEVAGWAIDLASGDGPGIDTVHIWAYPLSGTSPIWLGVAAYGDPRPDVGALFGRQFGGAAYGLVVSNLPPGGYDLVVYPHRARTDTFDGAQIVRVVVR